MNHQFLPVSKEDLKQRGIDRLDFVYITGDAYVDHPVVRPVQSIIGRLLESRGYTVGDPGTAGLEGQEEYHCAWRDHGLAFLYPQEIWIPW